MNQNCYHLCGPSGVKLASKRVRQVLEEEKPQYIIRADIKSFYRSIPHYKLIQDIKQAYDDPKVQAMLEDIITNPIETSRGYKNPVHGIALRGPLSQFFSGIYLKPLDDAFDKMDVTYLRYQDDIIVLCKTKRQLSRCRRKMMKVLHERRLTLSRKKSRIGSIKKGVRFLGIHYPGTQPQDNITAAHSEHDLATKLDHTYLTSGGYTPIAEYYQKGPRICPHPRTLRKAREQVKQMVIDGISTQRIKNYLHRWAKWWVRTSEIWQYSELLKWFIQMCWKVNPAYAAGLLLSHIKISHIDHCSLRSHLYRGFLELFDNTGQFLCSYFT